MKYKRFGETRAKTIILDGFVEMTWTPNNKKYYENKGYKYTKTKEKFMVRVRDLNPKTRMEIQVQCPICNKIRKQRYQDITKTGHSLCCGCACIKEMSGIKLGRLTFTDINFTKSGDGVVWWNYVCDCGNTGTTRRSSVISKTPTTSCGCYAKEVMESMHGENHYNWNPELTDEERFAGRRSREDKKWRKKIYERDGYTCQVCGDSTGGNLEAHHLYSYTAYPEHRLDLDNGVTLCIPCHEEFHYGFMGHAADPCTPNDFQRWLFVREFGK